MDHDAPASTPPAAPPAPDHPASDAAVPDAAVPDTAASDAAMPDTAVSDEVARLERAWREERGYLEALATRMLDDRAGAEDVVQDAFGRLMGVRLEEVEDVRGWLTVVVRRLCINRLRSAYARRETAVGAGAGNPEPGGPRAGMTGAGNPGAGRPVAGAAGTGDPAAGDPADRVTLDDQVRRALAVVLDRLTPAERTSFLLHDVFGLPFAAVGKVVGRTPGACRQLASRARRAVRAPGPMAARAVEAGAHDALVERFVAACRAGDLDGLVALLDPDVEGEAILPGRSRPVGMQGAARVAAGLLRFLGPASRADLVAVSIEGAPGVVGASDDAAFVARLDPTPDGTAVGHIQVVVHR